ncbi:hypothetical protein [Natronorubrum halophilum]|uniref:hypothetical protein n=1 Tax=Natronorubrum halophilum TaxID=1702106 RepID=UPI0010C1A750|nr:hypothetical protein [Natronorubrum halophilum]
MSIRTPEITSRLADDARAVFEAVTEGKAAPPNDETRPSVEREKANRRQRRRTPRVIELEPETVVDTPLEGTITVLGAGTGSDLLAEFEHALETDDTDLARDVQSRIAETSDPAATPDAPVLTDVVYHDRTVVTTPVGSDRFSAATAPYDGGSLDHSAFEIREHVADGTDAECEYRVIVAPPATDRAERDAADAAPDDAEDAAIVFGPARASVAWAFAAGVVVGVALGPSGSTDPALHQLEGQVAGEFEPNASVQALMSARDELHG